MKPILVAAILAAALAGCDREAPPPKPEVDAEAGRLVVEAECSGCHGLDGAGRTSKIPNLAAQPADYLVEAMHAYRDGRRHHAALRDLFESFDEVQVRNVAAYFAGLPPIAEKTPELPAGEAAYHEGAAFAAICTDCHGDRGISTTEGVPSLAGQQPAYLIVATQEYADGSRGHAGKEEMLRGLDQVDIEKMAMYFAAQSPPQREAPPFGDPQAGEALTAECGRCHGARGVSHDPLVPVLAGQEPVYLVNAITAYRDHERSHEDMIANRPDEEIEHIAAFYSVQLAGALTGAGDEVESLVAKCNRCHGRPAGESKLALPSLNGQKRDYLVRVMKEYRDEDRGSTMMHKMSSGYSDELIEQLADYFSSHPSGQGE